MESFRGPYIFSFAKRSLYFLIYFLHCIFLFKRYISFDSSYSCLQKYKFINNEDSGASCVKRTQWLYLDVYLNSTVLPLDLLLIFFIKLGNSPYSNDGWKPYRSNRKSLERSLSLVHIKSDSLHCPKWDPNTYRTFHSTHDSFNECREFLHVCKPPSLPRRSSSHYSGTRSGYCRYRCHYDQGLLTLCLVLF